MDGDNILTCLGIVAVIIVLVLCVGCVYQTYASVTYIDGTIVDTPVQHGDTYIIVKLDNGAEEIFRNVDDWALGKTNSGDFLIALKKGQHFRLKVNWFRVQLISAYRNILDYQQTPPPQK